jgi:CubicO group peptidase (beta-lactamase class C family)
VLKDIANDMEEEEPIMAEIHGICSDRFTAVRDVLAANLDRGADIGASAAVFIDGEPVVDIWGGYLDEARTRPWERDTIVNNFSTTKTMTALVALILADRGELDLDAPVAKYWPEFATNGKAEIEVRHLLSHTAGLPGWTETITFEEMYDREKATTLFAQQAPWWKPGTVAGYHPITFGPLIGEVVRRVTGKSLSAFFAEEVAGPLGADYHIGVGPEHDDRVGNLIQGSPFITPCGDLIRDRAFFNPYPTPQVSGSIGWRRAELGGSNGHGNARSVALVQSVLACGGEVRGVRLMSLAGCERALEVQADGVDRIIGYDLRWGMGYCVGSPLFQAEYGERLEGRRVACWGGSGGSWIMVDLDARMTVAYVMNRHLERGGYDQRSVAIVNAAYDGLAVAR